MKTLFVSMLIMLMSVVAMAQQAPPGAQPTREELLQKSKNQKTTGFVMLGAGAAAMAAGAFLFNENFSIWDSSGDTGAAGGAVLFVAGGLSMLGSIPLFIASSNNKERAMEMRVGATLERVPAGFCASPGTNAYPAVSVRISLR
jgi:uncharacterized membrane protein